MEVSLQGHVMEIKDVRSGESWSYSQVVGCGFSSHWFDTLGWYRIRFNSSRHNGCCMFDPLSSGGHV
jgi:hypothetical protein